MKKPSKTKALEVVFNNLIPFSGYLAITLFGKIYVRNDSKDYWEKHVQSGDVNITMNHETIHLRQAQSTSDSWIVFYLLYIWEWLKNQPWKNGLDFAYRMIPFEMEAYQNEVNLSYLKEGKATEGWRKFASMSVAKRLAIWKDYKSSKVIGFGRYLRERL